MRATKLELNPDKMEALWVGSSQVWEISKESALNKITLPLKKEL